MTKQKPKECVRGCGRMTALRSQFLHDEYPKPTCKQCDEEEQRQMAEEEAER